MQAGSIRLLNKGLVRGLIALALGAAASCGFVPLGLWPITIVALAGLIALAGMARKWRQAFLTGWLFGVGHFSIGNNWIATAFTYQADMPQWLGGIAVVLLSLYLAIFPAIAVLAAWSLAKFAGRVSHDRSGLHMPGLGLCLIPLWIITEWMRGWVFTGFAWNPLAMVLLGGYETQGLALLTPWIGTYALSGVVVALAALLHSGGRLLILGNRVRRIAAGAGLITAGGALGLVMSMPASYLERVEGARPFTLIQPDLRQETLGDPRLYETNFRKMAALSVPRTEQDRRLVLWPESGLADYLREGYPPYLYRLMTYAADPAVARERIGKVIGPYGLLLTGAVDVVVEGDDEVAARNSVTAIDWRGRILASYAKAHLVPYGEYLPMRPLLEPIGLTRLVAGKLDFWAGPGPRTLDFGAWGEAGIQICYEIVFSGQVVDPQDRPDYIFNPSNDGWFGAWGPPQHLAQARMRAIEEGLPVLRSTTTGISAVIDADGIVRDYLPRHTAGRIDGMIPPPHPPTLFSRLGNFLPVGIAILLITVSAVALRRASRYSAHDIKKSLYDGAKHA